MWEEEHGAGADPAVFKQEILPRLQGVALSTMAKASGLSEQYCSLIRRVRYVPHQRHWNSLTELVRNVDSGQCE